jgi:hypothetical protein
MGNVILTGYGNTYSNDYNPLNADEKNLDYVI